MKTNNATPASTLAGFVRDQQNRLGVLPVNATRTGRMVERMLEGCGFRAWGDLDARRVADWLVEQRRRWRPATERNHASAIRSWGRWALLEGYIDRDPFQGLRVPRCLDTSAGVDPITVEQADALIERARAECDASKAQVSVNAPARLAAYILMFEAGLRISEVRKQRWGDVDLDARALRVTADKSKRRDEMPLPSRAVEMLAFVLEIARARGTAGPDDLVVPTGPNARKLRADLAAVGATGPGVFHRLRKGAITARAANGSVWELTRWARHRDPRTTLRYVRHTADSLRGFAEVRRA